MIKIGLIGQEQSIPEPSVFREIPMEIKREARMADGTLVTDIIALKKSFEITYQYLSYAEMELVESLLSAGDILHLVVREKNKTKEYQVRSSYAPKTLVNAYGDWGYSNISIVLEVI